jgi:hypothetical protein
MHASDGRLVSASATRNSKTLFKLAGLQVTEAYGQSVGSVGRFRSFWHVQKGADHHLHLPLVGMTVSSDTGFYFARGVAADFDVVLFGGEQYHAAHFCQPEGGADIQCRKDRFHGQNLRFKFLEKLAKQSVEVVENGSRRTLLTLGRNAKCAVVENAALLSVGLKNPEPGRSRGRGVDAEYAGAIGFDRRGGMARHRSYFTAKEMWLPTDSVNNSRGKAKRPRGVLPRSPFGEI